MRTREIKKIRRTGLIAKLEATPKVSYSLDGVPSIAMTLKNLKATRDKDQWIEKEIFNAVTFNEKVIKRLKLFSKGDQVRIDGKIKKTELMDHGFQDSISEVFVERVKFLKSVKAQAS